MKKALLAMAILLLSCASGYILWENQPVKAAEPASSQLKKMQAMPTPVTVAQARKADMKFYLNAIGTVTTLNSVTVRSRVDGELTAVHFQEGSEVKKGALLAEIDSRPFQVQLKQAKAQLARDMAQLENIRRDMERYRMAERQNAVSRQQLDTQEALVRQYEAAVGIDKAQIEAAKLQITYSHITAPISGRVGLRLVDPGNMVHSSDASGLLTIVQTRPISVIFAVPEDNLPQILKKMQEGRLVVEAFDREMKERLATGELVTTDNQIDLSTGTVRLKAVFENKNNELFPNQFVNARLVVAVEKDAVIVPSEAVQRNPQGAFVFVLNTDDTVSIRPVKPGVTQAGETAISEGLKADERVVVNGTERLKDGGKVEVRTTGKSINGKNTGKKKE
ncbi:MAG: MdtA/MuxA family multidrug efflux RND transporter periplasmic adaptor subunit [Deltaproteobacteria bacterium]|nr:MdtA/MuxA family multidrug efflux RND transporter periplasmic adaptor subunit [Deltaproteobacteria bacterium]